MSLSGWVWAPAIVALLAFAWGGLISLATGCVVPRDRWRSGAGHVVLGMLLYSALFGALVEAGANETIGVAVLGLGTASGVIALCRARDWIVPIGTISGVVFLARLVVTQVPVNPEAVDPINYAFGASTFFSGDWLNANASAVPHFAEVDSVWQIMRATRASAAALVWPLSAAHLGVSVNSIFATSMFLLGGAAVVLFDTLRGAARVVPRMILPAAGIGVTNLISILVGGQINQAFGIFAVISLLWLARYIDDNRIFLTAVGLVTYAVGAAYPEMLAVLPLYLGGAVLLRGPTLRRLASTAVSVVVAFVFLQALTRLGNLRYLLGQAGALAGWRPLPETPDNPIQAWQIIVTGPWAPWWSFLVTVPLAYMFVRHERGRATTRVPYELVLLMLGGVVLLVTFWTWSIWHNPNINYATFKLGGWLAPALVVGAWALAASLSGVLRIVLCTLVLSISLVRVATLPVGAAIHLLIVATMPAADFGSQIMNSDASCVVRPDSSEVLGVLQAIAESAAPTRGCQLVPSL